MLDSKAAIVSCELAIGRVFSRCATVKHPIVIVPFLGLKQGRFQGVDVTNTIFVRGSYMYLSQE